MTREHLLETVTGIVAEYLHRTPEACPANADIFAELGGDDLDRLEINMAVEEKFGIDLTDDEFEAWRTIAELCAVIRRDEQEQAA